MWLKVLVFLGRHWKALALLTALIAALGWAYHKGSQTAQAKAALATAQREASEAKRAQANAEAALAASIAAEERNNEVLPRTRKQTAGRVAAAGAATHDDSVRLGREAVESYEAAAGQLSGASPR